MENKSDASGGGVLPYSGVTPEQATRWMADFRKHFPQVSAWVDKQKLTLHGTATGRLTSKFPNAVEIDPKTGGPSNPNEKRWPRL